MGCLFNGRGKCCRHRQCTFDCPTPPPWPTPPTLPPWPTPSPPWPTPPTLPPWPTPSPPFPTPPTLPPWPTPSPPGICWNNRQCPPGTCCRLQHWSLDCTPPTPPPVTLKCHTDQECRRDGRG